MVSNVRNMKLTTVDDLFSTEESRQASKEARSTPPSSFQPVNENTKQVVELSLDDLFPFKGHPFKVRDDDEMTALVESVAEYGVRQPVQVRPRPDGGYEILAGHRRIEASRRAEKESVPAIIENVDDDLATIIMVDTNLGQRQILLPSERAFAYKARLEAVKRQAGRPTKEMVATVATISPRGKSRDILAEELPDSARTIQNYISLTELIPSLLNAVDADKLKLVPAVAISHLKPSEQNDLWEYIEREQVFPSKEQANLLKEASEKGDWNLTVLSVYMSPTRQESSKATIRLDKLDLYWRQKTPKQAEQELMCIAAAVPRLRQYTTLFPENITPEQFAQKLMDLVERTHKQRLERQPPTR
ncbi:MAG TPA: ParB/RepB/Spo0J family partition protein [Clostridia bacterium]|nr:ParB/RepB/Spo0J family partition protein [Clostridia bacterium]